MSASPVVLSPPPLRELLPVPDQSVVGAPGPDHPDQQRGGRWRRPGLVATVVTGLTAALVALVLLSAGMGQMGVSPAEVLGSVGDRIGLDLGPSPAHPHADSALWVIRFPRIALALVVGAALAVGGVLMQGVFGNPLAEPGIVGVSAGAAAAACTVIVFGISVLGDWTLVAAAFLGGLATTGLAYATARQGGRTEVVTLVLTGIAVNAVAGAVIAFLTFLGDTSAREEIVFWQLGSLNGTRWQRVYVAGPLIVLGVLVALRYTRRLDLLALGERPARHLGVNVERFRIQVIVLVAVLTRARRGALACSVDMEDSITNRRPECTRDSSASSILAGHAHREEMRHLYIQ